MATSVTEVQINTPEMMRAKALEEAIYNKIRTIRDTAKAEGRKEGELTEKEQARTDKLKRASARIFEDAIAQYEKRTGDIKH